MWPDAHPNLICADRLRDAKRIGRGSFGCIYKAQLEGKSPQTVVIKVLVTISDSSAVDMLTNESEILAQTQHK